MQVIGIFFAPAGDVIQRFGNFPEPFFKSRTFRSVTDQQKSGQGFSAAIGKFPGFDQSVEILLRHKLAGNADYRQFRGICCGGVNPRVGKPGTHFTYSRKFRIERHSAQQHFTGKIQPVIIEKLFSAVHRTEKHQRRELPIPMTQKDSPNPSEGTLLLESGHRQVKNRRDRCNAGQFRPSDIIKGILVILLIDQNIIRRKFPAKRRNLSLLPESKHRLQKPEFAIPQADKTQAVNGSAAFAKVGGPAIHIVRVGKQNIHRTSPRQKTGSHEHQIFLSASARARIGTDQQNFHCFIASLML